MIYDVIEKCFARKENFESGIVFHFKLHTSQEESKNNFPRGLAADSQSTSVAGKLFLLARSAVVATVSFFFWFG